MPKNNKKSAPKAGFVYVLTNPAHENLVKIGRAVNLQKRINSLSSHSGVPARFEPYHAVKVEDAKGVEGLLQVIFADQRWNSKREFFEVKPEQVKAILNKLTLIKGVAIGGGNVTSDIAGKIKDAKAREKQARHRAKNFRFDALGIRNGAVLTFWRKPKLTATVVDDKKNKVEFKGKRTTVSGAANEVLEPKHRVNGTYYWEYKGKILNDIRTRKEQKATRK